MTSAPLTASTVLLLAIVTDATPWRVAAAVVVAVPGRRRQFIFPRHRMKNLHFFTDGAICG